MKKRIKKRTKLWEKIFVIASIIVIIVIIGIYAYRTIYYYKKTNITPEGAKLIDIVANQMNVVYSGDGLYKDKDTNEFYYYGKNVDNYLLYNGLLWRIISSNDNGLKIITDDSITSLVWGKEASYEKSSIYKWLNEDVFQNILPDDIPSSNWCNNAIDINSYSCSTFVSAKIGLITTKEYLLSGGINSYLNNNTYFWTLNESTDLKAYYVHSEGGINNEVSSGSNYYSYGVRPVINLSKDTPYLSGTGTQNDPYTTEDNQEIALNDHSIGTYVRYQGYTWKVSEITDTYTKLILDGYLMDENKEKVKLSYNKVNSYLNDTFLTKLNKDNLVKLDFIVTEYNNSTSYNYQNKKNTISSYVALPKVSDLFITEYDNVWLNTYANTSQKLVYTTNKSSSLFADLESSENYLRPVIALKNGLIIASGNGTKDNPFTLGGDL